MKCLINSLLFLLSTSVFAFNEKVFPIAKVLLIKGEVTALAPKSLEAIKLKQGDMLLKGTSVLVNGKGFMRLRFINDSTIILGPNSKIVVEMSPEDQTSMVNLLTGKVRAIVKKETNGENKDKKFLIKNQSAVMGVRGTDFQVTFNPKSKRTGLLTFEGQVDIAKNVSPPPAVEGVDVAQEVKELKLLLEKKFEPVRKGDFANIAAITKELEPPVKINPEQFVLLKRDESLGATNVKVDSKAREEITAEVLELKQEFDKEIVGRKDVQLKRELGLIDVNSGFYVPPADEKLKVLVGKINANGEYVPPVGVAVDPNKGLVVKADAPKEVVKLVKEVQGQMETQLVEEELDPGYNRYLKQ